MRRVLLISSLGLIALLCLLVPTSAQSKSLYWDRFDVDVTVLPSGDLQVVETQQITFLGGPFHYGYRVVPKNRLDNITDVQVREGDRRYQASNSTGDYTFSATWGDDGMSIRWYFPYTSDSTHTFIISYKVQGAVRRYPEGDEVWWKAIPDDRDYPIRDSRVSLHLPEGATVNRSDDGDGFVAETDGVPAELTVSQDRRTVVATANEQLGAKETLAMGVKFTPDVVGGEKPGWQDDYDDKVEWNNTHRPTANLIAGVIGLLVLVGAPLGIYLLWYTRGRDPHVGLVVDVLSEPPSDLPPGAAGTLLDEKADMEDVVATLVDLARRGYLTMSEEGERKFGGIIFRRDFSFRRTDKDWHDLRDYERKLLKRFFGNKRERHLGDLKNKFYRHVPEIKKSLYETIVQAGHFSASPDQVRKRYVALGIGLAVLTAGAGVLATIAAIEWVDAIWCPFIGLVLGAVGLIVGSQVMPAKTKKGAEAAARWNAFKRYLQQIQNYTELEQATELFEKYLPYAIAFGLERSWVNKFARIETTPIPTWYYPYWATRHAGHRAGRSQPGSGGIDAPSLQELGDGMVGGLNSMSDGLINMLNSTGKTLTSAPSSSSSGGGFSGGGFSGGGSSGGGSAGFG